MLQLRCHLGTRSAIIECGAIYQLFACASAAAWWSLRGARQCASRDTVCAVTHRHRERVGVARTERARLRFCRIDMAMRSDFILRRRVIAVLFWIACAPATALAQTV